MEERVKVGTRGYSRADLEAGEVAFPDLFLSNSIAMSPPRKGDPKLRAEVGSFPLSLWAQDWRAAAPPPLLARLQGL